MTDTSKYNKLLGSTACKKTHAWVIRPKKMQLLKMFTPLSLLLNNVWGAALATYQFVYILKCKY